VNHEKVQANGLSFIKVSSGIAVAGVITQLSNVYFGISALIAGLGCYNDM